MPGASMILSTTSRVSELAISEGAFGMQNDHAIVAARRGQGMLKTSRQ